MGYLRVDEDISAKPSPIDFLSSSVVEPHSGGLSNRTVASRVSLKTTSGYFFFFMSEGFLVLAMVQSLN